MREQARSQTTLPPRLGSLRKTFRFLAYIPTELLLVQSRLRFGVSADAIRPIEAMPKLGCPIFLLSGELDSETKPAEAQAMFDAAREPKQLWLVPGAKHEDINRIFPKSYKERVLGFLGEHMGSDRRFPMMAK